MKKRTLCILAAAIALAVILGLTAFFTTHISIDGQYFPKSASVIDLTDQDLTVEEYQELCRQHPDRQILWTVPFQGSRYPTDTQSLTLHSLTEAEVQILDYLPELKQVDGTQCTDVSALMYLQARRPNCQVLYQVPLGNIHCSSTVQEFTVTDATATQLWEALPLLPQLRQLTLEGTLPTPEALLELQNAFPDVELCFTLEIGGQAFPSNTQCMDLSATDVTAQELSRLLPLFPGLTELSLQDTTLTDAELKDLIGQFPDIFILCTLDFVGLSCSTGATEIDISRRSVTVAEVEALLPFFPRLQKLIMSHCGIDDESMDAFNNRHPNTSIVWTLRIGLVNVRTDATVFYPSSVNENIMPNEEQLEKLRYCTEMVAVDVGHCHTTNCEWARNMPHLKYLIIADNPISDLSPLSELKELIYLEVFRTNVTDYSPLLGCTALQDLNIGATYGDPAPLAQMPWLHNVYWWYGGNRDATILKNAQWLAAQLPDTNVVPNGTRSIDGGWRQLPNYYVFRNYIGGSFFNQEAVYIHWGDTDGSKILRSEKYHGPYTAAEILSEIVRYRIDNGLPIHGIKNVGSEKAEILYQTLINAQS